MFFAAVETNAGETLKLLLSDGRMGGEALLSFLIGLRSYCSGNRSEDLKWFSQLENQSNKTLCTLSTLLLQSFYSGDWDYEDDEYLFFQKRSPDLPKSEQEFRSELHDVQQKWVDIRQLTDDLEELIKRLTIRQLEIDEAWYDPIRTLRELETLHQTLRDFVHRTGDKVRIKFY